MSVEESVVSCRICPKLDRVCVEVETLVWVVFVSLCREHDSDGGGLILALKSWRGASPPFPSSFSIVDSSWKDCDIFSGSKCHPVEPDSMNICKLPACEITFLDFLCLQFHILESNNHMR
jgi:hypothetical protein